MLRRHGFRRGVEMFGWKKAFLLAAGRDTEGEFEEERSQLDDVRPAFAFLQELGYELTLDTDALSPHEYLEGPELRYEKGPHSVSILRADYRDPEWVIYRDGERFGEYFVPSPQEISARAAQLAKDLGYKR
jgi:hypothetical protein